MDLSDTSPAAQSAAAFAEAVFLRLSNAYRSHVNDRYGRRVAIGFEAL